MKRLFLFALAATVLGACAENRDLAHVERPLFGVTSQLHSHQARAWTGIFDAMAERAQPTDDLVFLGTSGPPTIVGPGKLERARLEGILFGVGLEALVVIRASSPAGVVLVSSGGTRLQTGGLVAHRAVLDEMKPETGALYSLTARHSDGSNTAILGDFAKAESFISFLGVQ